MSGKKVDYGDVRITKEEYIARTQVGKVGTLSAEEEAHVVEVVKKDTYLWETLLKHCDDVLWPNDFSDKLNDIMQSLYPEAGLFDLALLIAELRSAAGQENKKSGQ